MRRAARNRPIAVRGTAERLDFRRPPSVAMDVALLAADRQIAATAAGDPGH